MNDIGDDVIALMVKVRMIIALIAESSGDREDKDDDKE